MGYTAIVCAVNNQNFNILKFLVDSGGDVNVRDKVSVLLWTSIYLFKKELAKQI